MYCVDTLTMENLTANIQDEILLQNAVHITSVRPESKSMTSLNFAERHSCEMVEYWQIKDRICGSGSEKREDVLAKTENSPKHIEIEFLSHS